MANMKDLASVLEFDKLAPEFRPYVEYSREADAINFYFKPDPEHSERINEHVTLYRSDLTNEVVGCRVKGISGIVESLPNFVAIDHNDVKLKLIFWSFMGPSDDAERVALNELAKNAGDLSLEPDMAGA